MVSEALEDRDGVESQPEKPAYHGRVSANIAPYKPEPQHQPRRFCVYSSIYQIGSRIAQPYKAMPTQYEQDCMTGGSLRCSWVWQTTLLILADRGAQPGYELDRPQMDVVPPE